MIYIDIGQESLSEKNLEIREWITKAVVRSCSWSQVTSRLDEATILFADSLQSKTLARPEIQKAVVFANAKTDHGDFNAIALSEVPRITVLAQITHPLDQSSPFISFTEHELTKNFFLKTRAFWRFDFTTEWNNLGYGHIPSDPASPFGLAFTQHPYAVLFETSQKSILWFNRAVGPLDGFDWRIVEDFISGYRASELITLPVLSEVPEGFDSAMTMRIDCDENIASGRALFNLYQEYSFPFSLAIKTNQEFTEASLSLIQDVVQAGGSVVSHSHTHAPDWGGSIHAATLEFEQSQKILAPILGPALKPYSVSPFHQNSRNAVSGLAHGHAEAFVGGISSANPDYLFARSGAVPGTDSLISHSQQCMFHGDTYHQAGNNLSVYFDAFLNAVATETFFGYLDHPFSSYSYGWSSEEERLTVHAQFLTFMQNQPRLWRANLVEALDFMVDRAHTDIQIIEGEAKLSHRQPRRSPCSPKIRWNTVKT